MENRVSSNYNSLQMRIEKRFTNGLTGTASYTWGKAITDAPDHISTSGGGAGYDTGVFREPQDSYNLRAERGPSEFDVTHRFVSSSGPRSSTRSTTRTSARRIWPANRAASARS
jgi:hypothetical protein